MRVAVTGADGFTGRYVAAELERRGVDWVELGADLTEPEGVAAAVRSTSFDCVVHLAGIAFAGGADWRPFYAVNQLGTLNLLDAVSRFRPGARCILASTAQVYGQQLAGLLNETHACAPVGHYAISKYAMELGAGRWSTDLQITIVRPFNYTGCGQETHYLVPKLVDHFRRRTDTIELGNLAVERDFGDVRAAAAAYCDLAFSNAPPAVLNLGSGRLTTIGGLIETLEQLTGHRMSVRVNPAFVRPDDVPSLGADIAALRACLPDWAPVPIEETLAWMMAEDGP
jgi:nucleoside-diphosphate-sugar epimerase